MPELSELLPMVALILAIGAFAGVIAGLLGVGGGIVLVPAFFFAFDALGYNSPQLMQICLATSLATIIVTSVRSVLSHNKKGAVDWDILRGWGIGIAIGAVLGVVVASGLRSEVLQAIFGVLGVLVGLYLAFGKDSWRFGDQMPTGVGRAITSPILGFLSVLMGIGGGSFGVPLMSLYGVAIHRAVATAAGFGVLIAVPSVLGFLVLPTDGANRPPFTVGQVNLVAFFLVIAMTLITTPWGVKLAHAMDPKPLKRVFAFFIMLMALNMLRRAFVG
ncbi:MAG: sulfite exporter TauE/SafE family protein [Pseudomonadota bacterium]